MEFEFTAENILVVVELVVIIVLLWHIEALKKSCAETEKVIKELDADTKTILSAVDGLEKDIAKIKQS